MYMRYLLACLLAAFVMPAPLISAMSDDEIEEQEQQEIASGAIQGIPEDTDDNDNAMGMADPYVEDGDIDEDTSDMDDQD